MDAHPQLSPARLHELLCLYQQELREPGGDHLDSRFPMPREPRKFSRMAKHLENYPADALGEHPGRTWIWSDLHFGHENVISYSNRPFNGVAEMADALFAVWEETVAAEDRIVVAGDVCMKKALTDEVFDRIRSMPGHKILVPGNHDFTGAGVLRPQGFDEVRAMLYQQGGPGEPDLLITHLPVFDLPEGWINVHGHWHEKNACDARHINVSVEQLNYRPVPFEAIRALANRLHAGTAAGGTTRMRMAATAPAGALEPGP